MQIKKTIAVLAGIILTAAMLSACNSTEQNNNTAAETTAATEAYVSPELNEGEITVDAASFSVYIQESLITKYGENNAPDSDYLEIELAQGKLIIKAGKNSSGYSAESFSQELINTIYEGKDVKTFQQEAKSINGREFYIVDALGYEKDTFELGSDSFDYSGTASLAYTYCDGDNIYSLCLNYYCMLKSDENGAPIIEDPFSSEDKALMESIAASLIIK